MLAHVAPTTQRRLSRLWTPGTQQIARRALAQQEREARGSSKAAFELGWDFARYGLDCSDLFRENSDFVAGMRAGRIHWPRRRSEDRYIRKWLQLRASALARQVPYADTVTPAYLQAIDVETCPVTRRPMTRGACAPTDASVDRINNAIGYEPGNLVVMSVLANSAKADMGSVEMLQVVRELGKRADGELWQGLGIQEWARLATLAAYAEPFADAGAVDSWPLVAALAPLMHIRSAAWRRKIDLTARALGGRCAGIPEAAREAFLAFASAMEAATQERSDHAPATSGDGSRVASEDAWLCPAVNKSWTLLAAVLGDATIDLEGGSL